MRKQNDSERDIMIMVAKNATKRAILASRKSRLNIKSIANGILIERLPDGTVRSIRTIERVVSRRPDIHRGSVISIKGKR